MSMLLLGQIAYPCSGSWNACGSQDVDALISDAAMNCCAGSSFVIIDLCNNDSPTYVGVSHDGPNSSCIAP